MGKVILIRDAPGGLRSEVEFRSTSGGISVILIFILFPSLTAEDLKISLNRQVQTKENNRSEMSG